MNMCTKFEVDIFKNGWDMTYEGCSISSRPNPEGKRILRRNRGGRDVTLLKRSLTQPLANRSCCFAQAVGCKNVCYFCRTQRRSAGSSDSIRGVTEKRRKGYPWGPVGNTGGILSSLQEGQSDDWALQSWSTEHWRWPPTAVVHQQQCLKKTWKKWVI